MFQKDYFRRNSTFLVHILVNYSGISNFLKAATCAGGGSLYCTAMFLEQHFFKNTNQPYFLDLNPFSANFTKWSNTLKQFVGNLPMNCLSVFDDFVGLTLKGLKSAKEG